MEIERKFLISKLPDHLEQYPCKEMKQGYLCTSPVVRIRQSNDQFILTLKGNGLMVREEFEFDLTKDAFLHLCEKIDGILIKKTRYLIPLSTGLTAELDVFHGELAPLVTVEVEFHSIEEANSFVAPNWFGKDVTNDGRYHNSYLSKHPIPQN